MLPESAAILCYLASSAPTPDHWYPCEYISTVACQGQVAAVVLQAAFSPAFLSARARLLLRCLGFLPLCSAAGDLKMRAKVDAALDWNHSNVRANAAGLTWHRVIGKNLKQPVSEGQAKHFTAGMQSTFKVKLWTFG